MRVEDSDAFATEVSETLPRTGRAPELQSPQSLDDDLLDAVSGGAKKISASVGKGGKNKPEDTR